MEHKSKIYDIFKGFSNKQYIIIFVIAISLTAFLIVYDYTKMPEQVKKTSPEIMESLYIFAPKDGVKLVQNVLEIKADISEKQKVDAIMNELKRQKCIPEKSALYDFATDEDGVMYLNLSKEILNVGASQEITTTYAIVNTFISNFRNVNKVQLLVEGHLTETINGLLYIYKPLEIKNDLMEG